MARPWAYWAADWRSYQALQDAAKEIINMRNDQNKDLNAGQTYWDTSFKDTTPFGWPKVAGSANASQYLDNKNFRELSPSDQASLIASKQWVALANLQTIWDERGQREKLAGSALTNVKDIYTLQQTAREKEDDNLRQQEALNLSKYNSWLGYYDEKWIYREGSAPTPLLESYLSELGWFDISQVYQDPVTYIKWRTIHGWYDILTPIWTKAKAPVSGEVIDVGRWNWKSWAAWGWWNYVVIKAADWSTFRLAHLDAPTVKVWEKIEKWWILWYTGNTGNSTWPHLHIEQKDARWNLVDFWASAKVTGWNKLTQTALIDLSSKLENIWIFHTPEELRSMSPSRIAEVKSTLLKNVTQTSWAAKVLSNYKWKDILILRLGWKFRWEPW